MRRSRRAEQIAPNTLYLTARRCVQQSFWARTLRYGQHVSENDEWRRLGAAARRACLPPSRCTSLPPLSPLLASTRRRQFQVALESALSMTPLLVLENGRALADKCSFADGSRPGGCGWRTGAVGRRSRAGVKTQGRIVPKTWVLPVTAIWLERSTT